MLASHSVALIPWREISFEMDLKGFLVACVFGVLVYYFWKWRKGFIDPHLYFSDVQSLEGGLGRIKWAHLPRDLTWLSLLSFHRSSC